MKIKEIRGDLFSSSFALAHCVSLDFKMGAGIALKFRKLFQGVDELKSQNKTIGETALLKVKNRFIFYLITKRHYWDKPTIRNLTQSIKNLKEEMEKNHVTQLAIPKGLDKLKWSEVKNILQNVFVDTNIEIVVYCL